MVHGEKNSRLFKNTILSCHYLILFGGFFLKFHIWLYTYKYFSPETPVFAESSQGTQVYLPKSSQETSVYLPESSQETSVYLPESSQRTSVYLPESSQETSVYLPEFSQENLVYSPQCIWLRWAQK